MDTATEAASPAVSVDVEAASPGLVTGKRWGLALIGTVMLLFLGLMYAWAIFVPALEAEFGWTRSQTSLAFSICISMFCLGGLATGFITRSKPPKFAVAACAILIGTGFILASRSNSLAGMYISYGGFVGFGVGMGYNAIVSTIIKWFPDRRGLISGLMMLGYGCGALLLGTVGAKLLAEFGWRATFMGLGIFYAGFILLFSFFIIPPRNVTFPAPAKDAQKVRELGGDVPTSSMLRRRSFWLFFIWLIAVSSSALMFVAHSTPMVAAMGASAATAAFMPGLVSICNGGGRVIGGIGFDLLGRKKLMPIISSAFILAGALLFLGQQTGSMAAMTCAFIVAGLGFGSIPSTNAAVAASFFGLKYYSMNFSMFNMNLIISSLGPLLAGVLHSATGTYSLMPPLVIGLAILALALGFMIKKP